MLRRIVNQSNFNILMPNFQRVLATKHQPTCPKVSKVTAAKSDGGRGKKSGGGDAFPKLVRQERGGKVRMGLIPEEWFHFFYPLTGVSGIYIFSLVMGNYLFSKEIYIMEHEFYLGLSWLVIVVLIVRKFGDKTAAYIDKKVDDHCNELEAFRKADIDSIKKYIADEKLSQYRAEGQKLLVDAKKENVLMQLEAAYRERCLLLYSAVKGRLDYHSKRYLAESRIKQKWMIGWILENVKRSITPEFQKTAFDKCINDLTALAGRA